MRWQKASVTTLLAGIMNTVLYCFLLNYFNHHDLILQVALWDLALEKDGQGPEQQEQVEDLPPQLLFIHQGLQDIKEIHWHRQIPGMLVTTSHSGFDVFRTISV